MKSKTISIVLCAVLVASVLTVAMPAGFGTDVKEDVIIDLEDAKTGEKKYDKHIDKAIKHIEKSLDEKNRTNEGTFCPDIPVIEIDKLMQR